MARTAATSASTSVAKPAASTSRTSNPRKAASKRISYFESGKEDEDEEMEDAGGEGDTTLVGEEEEEEDEEPSGTLELAQLVKAFSKSRTKTEKAEAAKVAQQLKAVLEDGQKKVDEMVEKSREESAALLTSLNLDAPPSLGRLQPKNYQAAFAEQHALTQQLIKHVDEYKREVDPAEDAFFEAARQALLSRPHTAKKTYKKLAKTASAVVQEREAMATLHQGAANEASKHFKALTRI